MIERAIENWLISTNERNYQVPFCQALLQAGHKILYISSHRPMEQGKDIISIDKEGVCCAYQLKTGNLDLPAWRNIYGEINELVQLPVVHPSVDTSKTHKAFIVTNGQLTDEVRHQIDLINRDNIQKKRQVAYLEFVDLQAVLKLFVDAQGSFMPAELADLRRFLTLYLSDGANFLDKEAVSLFWEDFFSATASRRSDKTNAIGASIILNSYLLNNFQLKKNYYAVFEAWVLCGRSSTPFA